MVASGDKLAYGPLTALTEEEGLFQAMAREFATNEILPHVQTMDQESAFDHVLLQKIFAQGFMGIEAPEGYGGSGDLGGGQPHAQHVVHGLHHRAVDGPGLVEHVGRHLVTVRRRAEQASGARVDVAGVPRRELGEAEISHGCAPGRRRQPSTGAPERALNHCSQTSAAPARPGSLPGSARLSLSAPTPGARRSTGASGG